MQGTPRWRRRRKACPTSLASLAGSILQKEPLPGSSCDRGTLTKYLARSGQLSSGCSDCYLLRLRLWRMEFCQPLSAVL